MRFRDAIDSYIADQQADGRINSRHTERDYRYTLECHADDVDNRDPAKTGREDVKRTLARWPHPNSRSKNRSILVSFYMWAVETGIRATNPAQQVKRPKRRPPTVYRLTRDEARALFDAARTTRERRCIHIGLFAGLRRQELLGLQGRHFRRKGWIWVSADIAKGPVERWVPVLPNIERLCADIDRQLEDDDYVLPAQRWRDPSVNRHRRDYVKRPSSEQAIWRLVRNVGVRAGIPSPVKPHMLRHAFADHVTRAVGVEIARKMLGHQDLKTTQAYLSEPSLDDIQDAIRRLSPATEAVRPLKAPTGIEPVEWASSTVEGFGALLAALKVQFEPLRET